MSSCSRGEVVRLHARQHGPLDRRGARHLGLVRAPLRELRRHDAVGDDQAIADRGAERGERGQQRLDQRHRQRVRGTRSWRPCVHTAAMPRKASAAAVGPSASAAATASAASANDDDAGADAAEFGQRVAADEIVDRRGLDVDAGDRVAGEASARSPGVGQRAALARARLRARWRNAWR